MIPSTEMTVSKSVLLYDSPQLSSIVERKRLEMPIQTMNNLSDSDLSSPIMW